jgi:TnpA family transposase
MPRRHILTERQRKALFDLPADEGALLRHYTLDDDDIEHIRTRRHAHNKLGFALQLCAFRYPGRLLTAGEVIPLPVTEFLAAQIGVKPHELAGYAETEVTRRRHLIDLRSLYGHKMFSGRGTRDLKVWLEGEAETALSNEDLVKRFMVECQRTQTILPSISTIERLCADALVAAERRIETRIVNCLNNVIKDQLDALLAEQVDGRISRFIWLRQFEVGKNSACINRLLDRLEFLQGIKLPVDVLKGVPPHRIIRLRRQGERYFTDGLRDISSDRRLAILAVCAV